MRVGRGLGACAAGGAVTAAMCAIIGAGVAQAAEQRTQTFAFTGGTQQFVVPAGVTSLKVALIGGRGGTGSPRDNSESRGGEGESVLAQLSASPGELLFVNVAGDGESGKGFGRGGFGGGGDAEAQEGFSQNGGGGGGASDVRSSEDAAASRLVVAGGGGGGGGAGVDSAQPNTAFPGGSGGEAGARGQDGTAVNSEALGGEGGRPGGADAGGEAGGSSTTAAGKGSEGTGGNGGKSGLNVGGGGGGGIFGGGGGGGGLLEAGPNFVGSGSGGGGGGSSGVPAGSGATLLQEEATSAEPSITLTWAAPPPAVLTASVSALATTTATVNGTVNPDNSLVTACQFAIAPAQPAGATIPCAQQVGAGGSPVSVSAALSGLSPATAYTITLTATSAQGSSSGSPVMFTTAPAVGTIQPGGPILLSGPLSVTNLELSPTRFRRGTRTATIAKQARKKKAKPLPTSTTISFALSQAATVKLSFELAQPGVLTGRKCGAVSKTHRKGKRCVRYTAVRGRVTRAGHAGTDKITFAGVLDGGAHLTPGTYRLSLGATGPGGSATAAQHPSFTLLG